MSTYRVGRSWGVTIVREGVRPAEMDDCAFCCVSSAGCSVHPAVEDKLVAVVVNGEQELAERICALLNAPQMVSVDAVDLRMALDQRTGHSHDEPGRWDKDGSHCEECAARSRLRKVLP